MEHHHFSWEKSQFRLGHGFNGYVGLPEGESYQPITTRHLVQDVKKKSTVFLVYTLIFEVSESIVEANGPKSDTIITTTIRKINGRGLFGQNIGAHLGKP